MGVTPAGGGEAVPWEGKSGFMGTRLSHLVLLGLPLHTSERTVRAADPTRWDRKQPGNSTPFEKPTHVASGGALLPGSFPPVL